MKRIIELIKTILIVLLACSLTLLTIAAMPVDTIRNNQRLSQLLQPIAPLLGLPEAELAYVETVPEVLDAAKPVAISVRNAAGRSTSMWDFTGLDANFESLGSALGQALDTAELFDRVTALQVQSALSGSSVCFLYSDPLPAGLLASWLGAELEADVPAAKACILAAENDTVFLYLVGDTSYVSATQLDSGDLAALLEGFRPDGSAFGFETDLKASALSLIPGQDPVVPGGYAANPCTGRFVNELATSLGFNPYGDTRYTDDHGTTHFSEANLSLQVTADGRILLTSTAEDRFRAADASNETLAETARQLTALVAGSDTEHSRLYLTGLTRQGDETVCTFDYFVSGIPVALNGSAATVTFQGQAVTQLEILARTFTVTEQLHYPLPVAQAAAILSPGRQLELQYRVTADGELEVGWKE